MSLTLIISLILIGLILLIVEIVIIPGTSVAGFIGCGIIGVAVWGVYQEYGSMYGHITLGISIVLFIVLLYHALKPKTWKRISLETTLDNKVNTIDDNSIKINDVGITLSRLAPMGKALINDITFEVTSICDFIDENQKIHVVKIEGNKIIVKLINE